MMASVTLVWGFFFQMLSLIKLKLSGPGSFLTSALLNLFPNAAAGVSEQAAVWCSCWPGQTHYKKECVEMGKRRMHWGRKREPSMLKYFRIHLLCGNIWIVYHDKALEALVSITVLFPGTS